MSLTLLGQPSRHYEIADSTNTKAAAWAHDGAPHGAVVTAAIQTQGRGRRGRSWNSPPDTGLYLSLILRPACEPSVFSQFTLLAALGAARAVEKLTGIYTHTKWPNDVILRGKKIAGILTEMELSPVPFVIIGIGINVNITADDLPERPLFPASSLLIETGQAWSVEDVKLTWLQEFSELYQQHQNGDWLQLRDEFQSHCLGLGALVDVMTETGQYEGIARGIDDAGVLLVETPEGLRRVLAGDVHINPSINKGR